ncbi:MAG: DNA replication/repair protein RecF [Clostridia bacterium]|nr:DNA replication/repair protein RecF [Clostridia bacterium]MBR6524140.1 DNA replication/repair protein RecF [Clostridia bacterium]
MIVKNLKLCNFRNYEDQKFEFDEKLNIIYGNNAQGKTNILEALYLFSLGKSNRAAHDTDVIKFGQNEAQLDIAFISKNREISGNIQLDLKKRKRIFINEIPVRKNSELLGNLNVVFFGPEYLSLIREGPKKRRKNIDITISQLRPHYLSAVSDYKKLNDQKSSILKCEKIDELLLSVIDDKMLQLSEYIIKMRYEYIKKIEKIAKNIQLDISGGKEVLSMNYISCGIRIGEEEIKNLVHIVRKKMIELRSRELKYRECIFGPHRDDIEFYINGNDLKLFGSQGQQKTAILVQKIAEVELFKNEIGEYPVLLLDDIMSELDSVRQDYVINKIDNMQIFITCTDSEKFKNLKSGKFLKIDKGRLLECTSI